MSTRPKRALADIDQSLGAFDTILVLHNNIGLVGREASAPRLLRRLAAISTARADHHR